MSFLVEQLDVYQKSVDFADCVISLTESFPGGKHFLVNQLNRAAISIAANIAEGNGRRHSRDRSRFYVIARGSATECLPFLEIAKRRTLIDTRTHASLHFSPGHGL